MERISSIEVISICFDCVDGLALGFEVRPSFVVLGLKQAACLSTRIIIKSILV